MKGVFAAEPLLEGAFDRSSRAFAFYDLRQLGKTPHSEFAGQVGPHLRPLWQSLALPFHQVTVLAFPDSGRTRDGTGPPA